jgi:hypothetical protein
VLNQFTCGTLNHTIYTRRRFGACRYVGSIRSSQLSRSQFHLVVNFLILYVFRHAANFEIVALVLPYMGLEIGR